MTIGYIRRSKESGDRTVSLTCRSNGSARPLPSLGATFIAVLSDDGVSGGKRERLDRLPAAVREHRAKPVVFYDLDRLARDVAGALGLVEQLQRRGVSIESVRDGRIETRTANGFLSTAIKGVLAKPLPAHHLGEDA